MFKFLKKKRKPSTGRPEGVRGKLLEELEKALLPDKPFLLACLERNLYGDPPLINMFNIDKLLEEVKSLGR